VTNHFILLAVLQALNIIVHWWVQKNFALPRLIQPKIFQSAIAGTLLIIAPNVIGLILVVLAFFFTNSPWLFLGLSVAGFIAFAKPR
jgi:hypothetical protein